MLREIVVRMMEKDEGQKKYDGSGINSCYKQNDSQRLQLQLQGKKFGSGSKVLPPKILCTVSARTLNPEGISVPAPTPARGQLCWRLHSGHGEKVQAQAASAPTPHP